MKEIVAIGQNSRGAKIKKNSAGNDYFGFIRQTNAPAVIVETAFIDNATDVKIIDTAEEQKTMGIAIAKGILNTLGVTYKKTETDIYYRVQVGAFSKKENAEALLKKIKASGFDGFITMG